MKIAKALENLPVRVSQFNAFLRCEGGGNVGRPFIAIQQKAVVITHSLQCRHAQTML